MSDWITEEAACRAAGVEVAWGQCPGCGLAGVPEEQARRDDPAYMAELDALPPMDVPDTPAALCWGCRLLVAAGEGPVSDTLRRWAQERRP